MSTHNPTPVHAMETDAVSFQVVHRSAGEGVRGEYISDWPGAVRPMLDCHVRQAADPQPLG